MGKSTFETQSSFLDALDVDQLLLEGPGVDETSCASRSSDYLVDLEVYNTENLLLPDLNILTNSLEDISSFAGILSPMDDNEFPDVLSVHSFDDSTSSPSLSDASIFSRSSSFDSVSPSMLPSTLVTNSSTFKKLSLSTTAMGSAVTTRANPSVGSKKTRKFVRDKKMMKKKKKGPLKKSSPVYASASSQYRAECSGDSNGSTHKYSYQSSNSKSNDNWNYGSSSKHGSSTTTRTGRWSVEEHHLFLQGIAQHGRHWEKVAKGVKTRTTVQVRSHAQKYFKKLAHRERHEANGYSNREGKLLSSSELSDALIMKTASMELTGMARC